LGDCAPELAQIRSHKSCLAFAIKKLREGCLAAGLEEPTAEDVADEASLFAKQFSSIPEPGRSALALLYLKLFSVRDTAALLKMTLEDFSEELANARAALRLALADSTPLPSQP
jgi:DNA-directed RNA polymerase specialized sigma24 family protein